MLETPAEDPVQRAAAAIAAAGALLITAGAGMGSDSGLPTFRGSEGLWRAYPRLRSQRLSFAEIASPATFATSPELAWAFYGHRWQLYRSTAPHRGFDRLLKIAGALPGGYFVFTSNVDGQFQKAGFDTQRMLECHGSIDLLQCTRPCSNALWSDARTLERLAIDAAEMAVDGELPHCPHCGAVARPNILMFGDYHWIADNVESQASRHAQWLDAGLDSPLVVIECGAGTAIPTVRHHSERMAAHHGATLIRINPDEAGGPPGTISIAAGALDAIEAIAAAL